MTDRITMNPPISDVVDLASPDDIALADRMRVGREQIVSELRKVIVGQDDVIQQVLMTLFAATAHRGAHPASKTLLRHTWRASST